MIDSRGHTLGPEPSSSRALFTPCASHDEGCVVPELHADASDVSHNNTDFDKGAPGARDSALGPAAALTISLHESSLNLLGE